MNRRIGLALVLCMTGTGCSGMQSGSSASSILPTNAAAFGRPRAQHVSWMAGGIAKQDLLYVTNGNGEVTVYRYWKHTLVGVLTDFSQPMGECADGGGNVYITDYAAQEILEYAHGGTKPIGKFNDAPDSPYACAIDPGTGNLAVANDDGASQPGDIAIWENGSGSPTRYTDSLLYSFDGCAYDGSGNLLVTNGGRYPYGVSFAWLPKPGSKLIDINVPAPNPSEKWGGIAGIQWDGKYFALDAYYIYRISLIHGQAYYVGYTQLDSASNGPYWFYNNQPGAQATQVVGGLRGNSSNYVNIWHYPAGGEPIAEISHGVDRPFGVTISLKQNE